MTYILDGEEYLGNIPISSILEPRLGIPLLIRAGTPAVRDAVNASTPEPPWWQSLPRVSRRT